MLNSTSKNIKTILARYLVSPKHSLGQNFLINDRIIYELISTPDVKENDLILEIGTGFGAVTVPLAKRSRNVFSVDIEPLFHEAFRKEYPHLLNRVRLITHNVLNLNTQHLFQQAKFESVNYHVVGAIPYNITSPIIHKFLTENPQPKSITLLIQKEVAEKLTAQPPDATYLSNFVSFLGEAKIVKNNISPGAFFPAPRVLSAIVHIRVQPKYPNLSAGTFSEFLHQGFLHPRKMLRQVIDDETLERHGITPTQRPQELHLQDWVRLFTDDIGINT